MRTILWGATLGAATVLGSGCSSSDATTTGGTGGSAGGSLCNGESCGASINVPGGTFPQGRATEDCGAVGCQTGAGNEGCPNGMTCYGDEQPEHSSTVSSFALDQYEVTVGRFRKFVDAYVNNTASAPAQGSGANPNIAGSGWQSAWNASLPATQAAFADASHLKCGMGGGFRTWTDSPEANENKAINCVDWYEAFAFCIWDGGRLPTESEWEYAAAGGSENRLYPWGSAAPTCSHANAVYNGIPCSGGSGSVAAVGSTPTGNGRWGHADLGGNVQEWALDWNDTYPTPAAAGVTDYADISAGSVRAVRGSFFGAFPAFDLRVAYRSNGVPEDRSFDVGFRCARNPR
jgi:formylglycine-generating enzyme